MVSLNQDFSPLAHHNSIHNDFVPSHNPPLLPTEIWIEIISNVDLDDLWLNIRPCCLLFYAIGTEIAQRIIRIRVNKLCSVHSGNQLSLTTPHFHWNEIPSNAPTNCNYITWDALPEDQHPDIFLQPSISIPTCFSLYVASEMSWTYTLRVVFHLSEVEDDGIEKWFSESEGGWVMYYGTIKGPMKSDVSEERALKYRRVRPVRCVTPLAGLVRMLLLGPDQGY